MLTLIAHYVDGRQDETDVPALDAAALAFMAIASDDVERVELVKFLPTQD